MALENHTTPPIALLYQSHFLFSMKVNPEDGGSKLHQNVDN